MLGVVAVIVTATPQPGMAAIRTARVAAASVSDAPDESTGFQIDAAHDGHVEGGIEAPPLTKLWSKDFFGSSSLSYPLLTGGRVFVLTQDGSGAELHAFDAATGADVWGPVDFGTGWAGLAAGDGQVFTLTQDGLLSSYDQASGNLNWISRLSQRLYSSAPTYHDGVVYATGAGSGGTLYATDTATGTLNWSVGVENGDDSSPAVSDTGVYTSFACELTTDSSPVDGHPIWTKYNGCEGGGGRTAVLGAGGLWVRDTFMSPVEYDADTGALEGSFASGPTPAFDGTTRLVLDGQTLKVTDLATNTQLWSTTGDGHLVTAPFVDNGFVYEGSSSGRLFVYDEHTGQQVLSTNVGSPFVTDQGSGTMSQGIAGGNGRIAVSAGTRLVIYGSGNVGDRYSPLTQPTRVVDSRTQTRVGSYRSAWGPSQSRDVTVAGLNGVPSDADAVVVNATVTDTTSPSYLTISPSGTTRPLASSMNWTGGQTVANEVVAKVGANGKVSVYNANGRADVVLDVVGYFESSATDLFHAVSTSRVVDSRGQMQVGPYGSPWVADQSRDVTVAGVDGVPADADAVIVNATVTDTTSPSFLTVSPSGGPRPLASNLNWTAGETVANEVVAKVGADGKISVFNSAGNADVILDVVGYFDTDGGVSFHPVTPVRIQDSRVPPDQKGAYSTPWGPLTSRSVSTLTGGAIPDGTVAIEQNVTVTNTTAQSFLSITPSPGNPNTSVLNWTAGATVAHESTSELDADSFSVYNNNGSVDVIADASGWYG
jgi:hypothetical protein